PSARRFFSRFISSCLRLALRLYSLQYVPPIRIYKAEVRAGVLRAWRIARKCFVDKTLDRLLAMRAIFRLRTDKPADHALLGRPSSAKWRVLCAEHYAMLLASVLRKCSNVPIIDISITPIIAWC